VTGVAVTGIGAVTPAGLGPDALWNAVREGHSRVRRVDRFDPTPYRCQVAGQADDFDAKDHLPGRLVKKTDRFTHLAMAAANAAVVSARLTIGDGGVPAERVGVMVGNVLGGWAFAERELRELWTDGPREVSPYQATAWFPAAPQGNICIQFGIRGRARTFVCDRASGAYALVHAAETILRGKADVVLAGGTEGPLSPYAWLCCQTGGFLTASGNADPGRAYRPFDRRHGGCVIGEGSVFLVLERAEHAKARGVPILGQLAGWAVNTDGYMPYYMSEPHGQTMSRVIAAAMSAADVAPVDVGCVFADGSAVPREDATEVMALRAVLGSHTDAVPVAAAKPAIGHLMGAATVADAAVALLAMAAGQIPPIANLDSPAAGFDLDFVVDSPRPAPALSSVVINARGLGGVNGCLVLTR
jgi:3-oxoacyl-(acyl-carrier-protein) synthase